MTLNTINAFSIVGIMHLCEKEDTQKWSGCMLIAMWQNVSAVDRKMFATPVQKFSVQSKSKNSNHDRSASY